ncbi:MAG: response regulator [Candidatus Kariarchaeaceae archaeon]|jgi:CheY-like chemotaxis protein
MKTKIKYSILVVDDQDNWREALTQLLSTEGYTIKAVASFKEAKEQIALNIFDLVILDVRLMDIDVFNVQGIELLRLVKDQEPAPKAIILTGYPESIRKGVLERYGADALLLKVPEGSRFDTKGFKEKVKTLLNVNK